MYGPDYGVDHKNYLQCRILPKFISKMTPIFRYYSCVFRISNNKITTGRAIMLREHNVTYAFTIESSSFSYGTKNEETVFNQ